MQQAISEKKKLNPPTTRNPKNKRYSVENYKKIKEKMFKKTKAKK